MVHTCNAKASASASVCEHRNMQMQMQMHAQEKVLALLRVNCMKASASNQSVRHPESMLLMLMRCSQAADFVTLNVDSGVQDCGVLFSLHLRYV